MSFHLVVLPVVLVLVALLLIFLSVRRFHTLRERALPLWRRFLAYGFLGIAVLLLSFLALSACFIAAARTAYRIRNPPPGALYMVDGYRMHINCTGAGEPTIVLESAKSDDAAIWGGLQPVLSQTTRVCSYDRAGYGDSASRPEAMDADHIATELHGLLTAAKIDGPIVLAGHSMAGMYVRDYATRYPEQVKGIVFIDAFTPHQEQDPAFAMMGPQGQGIPIGIRLLGYGADTASALGLERLLGVCSMKMPGLDAAVARRIGEDRCRTSFSTMLREAESISRSGDETVHTGPYGDLPILIFSHGPNPDSSGDPHAAQTEAAWNRMQENLKLSTRSRRIIAKRSNHYIQFSRSELLEREIPAFIEQIRGNRPWPAQFGTTTVE